MQPSRKKKIPLISAVATAVRMGRALSSPFLQIAKRSTDT